MKNKTIVKILMIVFSIRPIIDLFYNYSFAGINPAGYVALLTAVLACFSIAISGFKFKVSIPILVFVSYTLLITLLNMSSFSNISDWLRIFSSVSFYFAVAPYLELSTFRNYVKVYLMATMIPIVFVFLQVAKIMPYQYFDWVNGVHVSRATGGFPQPAVLTRFLVFGLLYALYLFREAKTNKQRIFYMLYCFVNLVSIFLTYHRTGYLLAVIILLMFTLYHYRGHLVKFIPKIAVLVVVGVIAIAIMNSYGMIQLDSGGFQQLLGFSNIIRTDNGQTTLHLRGRGIIAETYLGELFNSNNWLFGFGNDLNPETGSVLVDADMDIIRMLWSFGVVGLIIWIVLVISLITSVWSNKTYSDFVDVVKIGLIIYIVFGFTMDTTIMPNFMMHVYVLVGLSNRYNAHGRPFLQKQRTVPGGF